MANTSTISASYQSAIAVTESFSGFTDPTNNSILVNQIDESGILNASSTPPASMQSQFSIALVSGAVSIDLTALPGLNGSEAVNGTGLKVQLVKFKNPITNANKITVAKGASNGYGLDASGDSFSIPLSPGQSVMFVLDAAAPAIASGAKTFDLTGTGTQALQVAVVMG